MEAGDISIMPSSSFNDSNCLDELDTEFSCDIKHCKDLVTSLIRPKDSEIAKQLITRVVALNGYSLEVKSHRNEFTKYFLKVLKKTAKTQPPQYEHWFKSKERKIPEETSLWSPDKRTFVATKNIPGFGMLVYLAVSYEPHLGWQENGFLTYDF